MSFEETIKNAWASTPAKLTVKEISRRSQLPKWEDCAKDAIHVGIIRRKRGDRLIVVRHQIVAELDLSCKVEELDAKGLVYVGAIPSGDQICSVCGEFATRINIGKQCNDCTTKG